MRCSIVRCFLPDAQSDVITDLRIFRYDCLAKLTARPNLCIVHDNGVTHNRIFTDRNTAADYRVINLSVNLRAFSDDTAFDYTALCNVLRRQDLAPVSYTHLDVYKRQPPAHPYWK